jgi:hypothetical protein
MFTDAAARCPAVTRAAFTSRDRSLCDPRPERLIAGQYQLAQPGAHITLPPGTADASSFKHRLVTAGGEPGRRLRHCCPIRRIPRQEGALQHAFRVRRRAEQPVRQPEQTAALSLEQLDSIACQPASAQAHRQRAIARRSGRRDPCPRADLPDLLASQAIRHPSAGRTERRLRAPAHLGVRDAMRGAVRAPGSRSLPCPTLGAQWER